MPEDKPHEVILGPKVLEKINDEGQMSEEDFHPKLDCWIYLLPSGIIMV